MGHALERGRLFYRRRETSATGREFFRRVFIYDYREVLLRLVFKSSFSNAGKWRTIYGIDISRSSVWIRYNHVLSFGRTPTEHNSIIAKLCHLRSKIDFAI